VQKEVGCNQWPRTTLTFGWAFVEVTFLLPSAIGACCASGLVGTGLVLECVAVSLPVLLYDGYVYYRNEAAVYEYKNGLLDHRENRKAVVLRDGTYTQLPSIDLVPGDVVNLVCGMEVLADVEILDGTSLVVDLAPLTGDASHHTFPSDTYGKIIPCGSNIVRGDAICVVRKTGTDTGYRPDANGETTSQRPPYWYQLTVATVKIAVAVVAVKTLRHHVLPACLKLFKRA
jgi:magnesium-transporting ATPase (P-type)